MHPARIQSYKSRSILSSGARRRRRGEEQVHIRRQKRNETHAKRRQMDSATSLVASDDDIGQDDQSANLSTGSLLRERLSHWCCLIASGTQAEQLKAVSMLRRILSVDRHPPIDAIISAGLVPYLVDCLGSPNYQTQFEAAWTLTNIASGASEHTRVVMRAGAVPAFIELLSSPVKHVCEQAVWALGNIAGDNVNCRDYVLESGAMTSLLPILWRETERSLIRNVTWTLNNLCRGKTPPPKWTHVGAALPELRRLLNFTDKGILIDACWAVSFLSDEPDGRIQETIDAGLVPRLVELLNSPSIDIQIPALRSVGSIVTGDDLQTDSVIVAGGLQPICALVSSPKETIRKEACWAISNITAGSPSQIQAVIDADIVPHLVSILRTGDCKARMEACWAVSNATSAWQQHPSQVHHLVSQGCIQPMCELLDFSTDNLLIQVVLDGLDNILKVGELDKAAAGSGAINQYAEDVEAAGGMLKIHLLQNHQNLDIYRKSFRMMDVYFPDEGSPDEGVILHTTELDGSSPHIVHSIGVSALQGEFSFCPPPLE